MSIDSLFKLTPEQSAAAQIARTDQDGFRVLEQSGYRWLCTDDDSIQSIMRVDAPAELILPNHVAMLIGLLLADTPKRVLNLGFGIGSLERFLHNRLPALEIISVDASPVMVDLAREHFHVPHDWPVTIQSAEDFLHANVLTFDLMLCDLFAGASHADCLYDTRFYRDAAQHLSAAGVLSLNLSTDSEQDLIAILMALRKSFEWVALVTIPSHSNVVVLACRQPPPPQAALAQRAARDMALLELDFAEVLQGLEWLPAPT